MSRPREHRLLPAVRPRPPRAAAPRSPGRPSRAPSNWRPAATFTAGTRYRLTGRSWSGTGGIRKVEVSTDAGATWHPARLHDHPRRDAWTRWSTDWHPTAPGPATLLARTTDTTGHTRPDHTTANTQGYLFDAVVRHPVTVVG